MSGIAYLIFAAGIGFLAGFKVAAFLGKRQRDRLQAIWKSPPS